MTVSSEIERQVIQRASGRCEYCRMHQSLQGATHLDSLGNGRPNESLGIESLGIRRSSPQRSVRLGKESLGLLRSAPEPPLRLGIESLGIRRSAPQRSVRLGSESFESDRRVGEE